MSTKESREHADAGADEASEESFPSSDPPATWAGADQPFMPDPPERSTDPGEDPELPR